MKKLFLMTVLFSGSGVFAGDSGTASPVKHLSDERVVEYTVENLIENASNNHVATYDEKGVRAHAFEKLCAMCPVNRKDKGTTALHEAVRAGILPNVVALLYMSANTNVTNGKQETPLHLALVARRQDIVEVLKRAGASERFSGMFLPLPQEVVKSVRHSDK